MTDEQTARQIDENFESDTIQVTGKIEENKLGPDFVLHVKERMEELELSLELASENFVTFLIDEIMLEKKYEHFKVGETKTIESAYDRYYLEGLIERDWINFLPTVGKINDFNIKPELVLSRYVNGLYCLNKRNALRIQDNINSFSYCNFKIGDLEEYTGFVAEDGKLIIIYAPIIFVLNKFGLEMSIDILEKMLDIADNIHKNYRSSLFKENTNDLFHNDFIALMLAKLYMKLEDNVDYSVSQFTAHIKNIMSNFIREEFSSRDYYKGTLSCDNISFLCLNQSNMYRRMITKFFDRKKRDEDRAFERGMRIGSRFNSALYEAEYIYDAENNVWTKEVNIIPKLCVLFNKLYQIPEKKNKYHVTKLIFDFKKLQRSFVISSEGYHPNINRNSRIVCIGDDLNRKFETILKYENSFKTECYDFLVEIEEALTVVNFDSSYWSMDKDGLSTKSLKLVDINGKVQKTMHKNSTKTLRKV